MSFPQRFFQPEQRRLLLFDRRVTRDSIAAGEPVKTTRLKEGMKA